MKILLTGGSGFLGSALARHLHNVGHDVALLLQKTSVLDRLRDIEWKFEIGRCTTDDEVAMFVERVDPDVVIHTACVYGRHGETYLQLADANVRLGLLIMQALLRVQRPVTFINTGTVLKPDVSAYALGKHQLAHWGRLIATMNTGRFRFINILLQHMYGPGDDPSKFTTNVLRACRRNDPELKLTNGEQKRDFIYIDDVVGAYAAILQKHQLIESVIDVEVGSGNAPSIRDFVEEVHRITGSSTRLRFGALPYRTNEAMHCEADLTYMNRLGWSPVFDLRAGIKRTLEEEYSK